MKQITLEEARGKTIQETITPNRESIIFAFGNDELLYLVIRDRQLCFLHNHDDVFIDLEAKRKEAAERKELERLKAKYEA